MEEIRGKTQ